MSVLEIEKLRKSFVTPEGQTQTVIDIDTFTMDEGQQMALEGESGSGKTTFLNLIAGILRPDAGVLKVVGQDLSQLTEAGRDRHRALNLGYVFQTFNLLQGYTALENIILAMTFGVGADAEHAKKLLSRVGMGERMNHRPGQLSVGQQQRVAVARALANRPKIVLADEPTGNLDPRLAQEALSMIREICEENKAALLLVSHDPAILGAFEHRLSLKELNAAAKSEAANDADKPAPEKPGSEQEEAVKS